MRKALVSNLEPNALAAMLKVIHHDALPKKKPGTIAHALPRTPRPATTPKKNRIVAGLESVRANVLRYAPQTEEPPAFAAD